MFSIFKKKKFLVDYLEGFIDIHNHILPGIDDGSKSTEDSISMLKTFGEFGVKNFVATPHIMDNYYPNTPETINKAFLLLKNSLVENDMTDVSFEAAAEHMIDGNFDTILKNKTIMPLKKRYLLVEMSYLQPSINFKEAIEDIASAQYFPILAHPERYVYLHNRLKKHQKNKNRGILFQLNLLSVGGYYGKDVQQSAIRLLDNNLIDFVASDVHNMNQLNELKNLQLSPKIIEKLQPIIENTVEAFT